MTRLHPPTPEEPLSGIAYRTLWNEIRTCELLPGQMLTERQIAARLGIGFLPARDALVRLTHDGLVQPAPRRTYRVTPLTQKSVDDFFLTWRLIGPEIARRGVRDASAEQIATIRRLTSGLGGLPGLPPQVRSARFAESGYALFELLAVATANDRLTEAYRSLAGEMTRIWSLVLADAAGPALVSAAGSNWRPALDGHDGDRAAAIARSFIEATHRHACRLTRAIATSTLRNERHATSAG